MSELSFCGFLVFRVWRKKAESKSVIAGPKLLLDIWGLMISAGRRHSVGSDASLRGLSSWTNAPLTALSFGG